MGYFFRQFGKWGVVSIVIVGFAIWAIVHFTSAPCSEVRLFWGALHYTKPGENCQAARGEVKPSKPVPVPESTSMPSSIPPVEIRHGIPVFGIDTVLRQIRAERRVRELGTMESGRKVYQMAQQSFFFVDLATVCRASTAGADLEHVLSQAQALRFREPKSAVEVHYQSSATGYVLEVFGSEESSSRIAQLDGHRTAEIAVSALPILNNTSLLILPVKRVVGCMSRYVQSSPKHRDMIHDMVVK